MGRETSPPARVTSKHSFTAAGVIALPFEGASSIHHRWLCCRYTWRHITLAGQWPICSTISTMIAPSSFSSSLSSDQQTRLGLLLLSAMAWPQCPQLCLLIKTHQLLSLAPHPPYKAIHRPTQQLTTCQKTKVDDRPVVVVYWVVGSETAEKNVLVANTRVCLPSILPFHAPSPADHLTIPHLAAIPTRKCPQRVSQNAPEINPARWYIQKELQDRFI